MTPLAQGTLPFLLHGCARRHALAAVLRLAAIAALVLLQLALAEPGRAQPPAAAIAGAHAAEAGLPYIRNFDPAEYGAAAQNWAIAQDRQGVIYVGNTDDGVLAFDGTTWRKIAIPNLSTVRALAADGAGRIYVGAVGELGYLAPDGSGRMRYVSLLDRIPPEDRDFKDVWRVFPTAEGVYFATYSRIFRLRDNRVIVWTPATSFHKPFWARGSLLVREVDRGLMQLVGDRLVLVPGGERFATEKIYALLPWGAPSANTAGDLLIGTRTQGWFIFDGAGYRPWITEADAALKRDGIYGAIWLADGTLAVATEHGGVSLLDGHGRLLQHLTKASGLPDDVVHTLFEDRQRGLWLGLNNGIARIDLGSPLTQYDERTGLEGSVYSLQRYAGRLHVGTTQGVFRLDTDAEGSARFAQIKGVPGVSFAFLDMGRSLLVATTLGVFEIGNDTVRQVWASEQASAAMLRSKHDPSRVFVGLQDGIASLRLEKDRWVDEGKIPGIADEVRTLFEEPDGRLWLGLQTGGVIRLTFPRGWAGGKDVGPSVRVERFGIPHGLPVGESKVYPIDGLPRFTSTAGVLQFDAHRGRFIPDPRFAQLFPAEPRQVWRMQEAARGRVWMATIDRSSGLKEVGAAVPGVNGITRWVPTPLQPISGSDMYVIHGDPDGVMWFGGAKGLFRYDPGMSVTSDPQFTALVRKVVGRDGHLVFDGTGRPAVPQIEYANNALRIEFAGPSYDALAATRFQVLLEGLDPAWSAWSSETYRDYSYLPAGDYRFRVRARNVYRVVSAEASYAFRILPPWYRTWWATLGFALLVVATLWLVFRWRVGALRRHNIELAGLVSLRTEELLGAKVLRERNRIAREIHDTLAQGLIGIKVQIEVAKELIEQAPAQAFAHLNRAQALADASVEEAHHSVWALRGGSDTEADLAGAVTRMVEALTLHTPLQLSLQIKGEPPELDAEHFLQLLRLLREAVVNVIRHAHARHLGVEIENCEGVLQIVVRDDGRGFVPGAEFAERDFGLTGMRERAQRIGAKFRLTSAPGQGTVVEVTLPIAAVNNT
jgi:signal transduction histidine kinase